MVKHWAHAPVVQVSPAFVVASNNVMAGLEQAPEHDFGGLSTHSCPSWCLQSRGEGGHGSVDILNSTTASRQAGASVQAG